MGGHPGSQKLILCLFSLLIFSLVTMVQVHAGGRDENSAVVKLREAESLIEEKEYSRATDIIVEVVRNDPDQLEAAEKLMQKIREIKNRYNDFYEELIEVLFTRKDLTRAYELIEKLHELDPNPNAATALALAKAREGVAYVYFLNSFNDLMDEALTLIKANRYIEALGTYAGGYSLEKQTFDEAGYGNIIQNSVNSSLNNLLTADTEFRNLATMLQQRMEGISALFSAEDLGSAPVEVSTAAAAHLSMRNLITTVEQAVKNFQDQNEQIKKSTSEGTYDLFLHFAGQLASGRSGSVEKEGTVAVMRLSWKKTLADLIRMVLDKADILYDAALKAYHDSNFASANKALNDAGRLYLAALDSQAVRQSLLSWDDAYSPDEASLNLIQTHLPDFLLTQEKLKEISYWKKLLGIRENTEILVISLGEQTAEELLVMRARVKGLGAEVSQLKLGWLQVIERYREISVLDYDITEHIRRAEDMLSEFDQRTAVLQDKEAAVFLAFSAMGFADWELHFQTIRAVIAQARALIEGVVPDTETGVGGGIAKYPERALALLEPLEEDLIELADTMAEQMGAIDVSSEIIARSSDIQSHLKRIDDLTRQIGVSRAELARLQADARETVLLAGKYKREGLLRYQQAQTSLANAAFKEAREAIQDAQMAFDESLRLQEDPGIRRLRDEELAALSAKIIEEENKLVIREVRQLIDQGKSFFYQEEFARAELTLLKADARYKDTNPGDDKEITFWLELIRSARAVVSGRVIEETDPLYITMIQLHNLAVREYQNGKALLERDEVRAALEQFYLADEKLTRIKTVFPYNREARILSLRIEQLRDEDGFAKTLTANYNEAIAKQSSDPREAYLGLKDLVEEFNPNYPGLKEALYNLEIALGMRIPPPDPVKLAESRDLTNRAKAIYADRLTDFYSVALAQLNRAIELNPNNTEAARLKDTIQLVAGGTRQLGLSSAALQRLRAAEAKYLEGNYLEAQLIVEKLLEDPQNKGYAPLLKLEKRIKTKI